MKHVAELASSGSEKATQEKLKILRQQKGPIPKVLANYEDDVFAVLFANILSRELKEQFKYQAQFQVNNNCKSGQNPSIDTAILVLVSATHLIPTVLYQYKPLDPSRVDMMAMIHLKTYCNITTYK